MPSVLLTAEQRIAKRNADMRRKIGDALAVVKNRTRMSEEEMGKKIGVGRSTMHKLLVGDDVEISVSTLIRAMDMAGLYFRQRGEESE